MIDWLELLWKAAEEGTELSLPEETSLRGRAAPDREEEEPDARDMAPEAGSAPWQDFLPIPAGRREAALPPGKTPVHGFGAERLSRSAAGAPLAALYRQVRETVVPLQTAAPGQGNRVVVREEVPAPAGLTEEGLDRSLRRDSRRYDGGMSIY